MPPTPNAVQAPDCDHLWNDIYGDLQRVGPAHFHERRIAGRLLSGLDYRSLLDVGCGPGWNLPALCAGREVDRVVGIDISAVAIERARRSGVEGEFLVHDIQQGAVPGHFDLVHCSLALHLIPDDEAAIRHLREATGKYLLISTMVGDFERYKPWEAVLGAVRNYRKGELEDKLTRAGLRVTRAVYWGFPFYSPMVRTLQNYSAGGSGSYGAGMWLVARALRLLYYLNSSRRGDLLVAQAEV
jgi:SAM-dependent methyltransferase